DAALLAALAAPEAAAHGPAGGLLVARAPEEEPRGGYPPRSRCRFPAPGGHGCACSGREPSAPRPSWRRASGWKPEGPDGAPARMPAAGAPRLRKTRH
ncbi:hypothetical protein, partial [uncultured Desulfovibrio sp.]|uniref:hypothetical protein n=1 Tax=uncultured Desulfovibrio sp. TaxID=167968 RepID=UPI00262A4711